MVSWAMPIASATALAPSSSPVANAGDTAVTARARAPSARYAAAATSDESTPPENATTTPPRSPLTTATRSSSDAIVHRRRDRLCPDRLHRPRAGPRERGAIVVLWRNVHDAVAELPQLHAHGSARQPYQALLTSQLGAVKPRNAAAQGRGLAQDRADHLIGCLGARQRREHNPRTAFLHLHRGGPDIESAHRKAALDRVGDHLRQHVVDVRLDEY